MDSFDNAMFAELQYRRQKLLAEAHRAQLAAEVPASARRRTRWSLFGRGQRRAGDDRQAEHRVA